MKYVVKRETAYKNKPQCTHGAADVDYFIITILVHFILYLMYDSPSAEIKF